MNDRKQGSTTYPMQFFMTLASDHLSGAVGLSPTVTISKNGAALAAAAGAVTEVGSGWYSLAGNATDRNTLGEFLIHATGTGADPADKSYVIVPWDPFDANLALQALPAAAAGATGGLPTVDGSNGVKLSVGTGTGQVSLATGQVTTGTLNDKTGMALTSAEHTNIQTDTTNALNAAIPGTPVANSVFDRLDAKVSSRMASGNVAIGIGGITNTSFASGAIDATAFAQGAADKTWATATRALTDKAGFALSAAGVDLIIVETGLNLRQSQSVALAALAGILSGAGTATITITGAGVATVRIVATVDASGNRSALTLTPPT